MVKTTTTSGLRYGSDELEGTAFVRRVAAPTPTSRSLRRVALAVAALVVSLGTGLGVLLSASPPSIAIAWSDGTTASLQSLPTYNVPLVLQTTREFLLRIKGKNDLCLDDGGAAGPGQAKLAPWPCNPSNVNQLFVYNATSYQLRSARKTDANLCLEAGRTLQLQVCNVATANQRFTYNTATQQLRAPAKANMCLDDGSATRAGATRFAMFFCDTKSANQRIDIVFGDDAQTEQQRAIDAAEDGTTRFQLRAVGKNNLCVDSAGGSEALLRLATCDAERTTQLWRWELPRKRIRSATMPGLCLDDSGTNLTVAACDAVGLSQAFVYDKTQQSLRSLTKNQCVDDSGALTATSPLRLLLGACDMYNANQHFTYVAVAPPAAVATPALLQGGRAFALRVGTTANNLCLDDGSDDDATTSRGAGGVPQRPMGVWPCNPSNTHQQFVYDTNTNQLRSAHTNSQCLDDGSGATALGLTDCDPFSTSQRFTYDVTTQTVANPLKPGVCLDSGGGVRAGETQPTLKACDATSVSQRFELRFTDEALVEQQRVLDAVASGAKFLLRAVGKDNLCIDDGGATTANAEASSMGLSTCAFDDANQVFLWDTTRHRLRSFMKKGLCIDGSSGATPMMLATCDTATNDQAFVFDQAALLLRNVNKPGLCIDDGGVWTPTSATVQLATCDVYSPHQHFEYVLLPPLPVYETPSELQTTRAFVLRILGKNSLCVDDGGSVAAGDTALMPFACNPSSTNQTFVYDAATNQLRSAHKPGLCVDDGGATTTSRGTTSLTLGDCDADNRNQRFVFDSVTQMFRNPMRTNLCIDDGGAVRGGTTQLTLKTCSKASAHQHFQVRYQDELLAAQQTVLDAALLRGAKVLLRAVGKRNLCVDDGGGTTNGATQLWLATCDQKNGNQVFVWDVAAQRLRSVAKGGLCVDDAASTARMWLWTCDAGNTNQDFVYDRTLQAIRNPSKAGNLCVDDGGSYASLTAKMLMLACDPYSPNQRFELVVVP